MAKLMLVLFICAVSAVLYTESAYADSHSDSNVTLVARGTGTYTCQNGEKHNNIDLFMWVTKDINSKISGLGLSQNKTVLFASSIDDYSTKHSRFVISGKIHVDELCNDESKPADITIRGICTDSFLVVKTSAKAYGFFTADVLCN